MEEVFGYPAETSYSGYAAKGTLKIQLEGFTANAPHYFTTGELYHFYQQLQNAYNRLTGTATLKNIDCELELQCAFDKLGQARQL